MSVGSVEIISDEPNGKSSLSKKLVGGGFTGSGSSGGGNGGNDGGGRKSFEEEFDELEYPSNKFRIGMWFLLLVVVMTFGGLVGAYIVISTKSDLEWQPFQLPGQIWISTLLLIASSATYFIAKSALNANYHEKAKKLLLGTTVLGGMFIASQLLLWSILYGQGVYMASNPYAGFFYIMTAIHAMHVVGGVAGLGYLLLRTWDPTSDPLELENRRNYANVVGWYWHFMDGIWLVLVLLLGFWR